MIGLFAAGEVLYQIRQGAAEPIRARFRDLVIIREELSRSKGAIARGSVIGYLLPTLALGIPDGATTAVLLGAFTMYGIHPGPLFEKALVQTSTMGTAT
ncbi:tripartite tricarboxylate transporter permease [Nonomuraea sp. NPDC050451]|uniref:tripartite tricarboxylate transporter permease n=1 Tax=Nonomuraea sp. NPDC050451 TaxID=3364364 RepID=UPI0037BD00FE